MLREDGDDGGRNERRISDSHPLSTGFEREKKAASSLGIERHGATQREIVFGEPW